MSPRKRPRGAADPAAAAKPNLNSPADTPAEPSSIPAPNPANSVADDALHSTSSGTPPIDINARYASLKESKAKSRSWYGSWPRVPKSSASTQVARETILGGTTKPSGSADFSKFEPSRNDEGESLSVARLSLSRKSSTMTLGGNTKATGSLLKQAVDKADKADKADKTDKTDKNGTTTPKITVETPTSVKDEDKPAADAALGPPVGLPPLPGTATKAALKRTTTEMAAAAAAVAANKAIASLSTRSTMTKPTDDPPSTPSETPRTDGPPPPPAQPPAQGWMSWVSRRPPAASAEQTVLPEPPKDEPEASAKSVPETSPAAIEIAPEPQSPERPTTSGGLISYFWSGSAQPKPASDTKPAVVETSPDATMKDTPAAPSAPIPVPAPAQPTSEAANSPAPQTATASAGSTWAFWSRDSKRTTGKSPATSEPGEIAVMGDRSEAHPTPATGVKVGGQPSSTASSIKDVPISTRGDAPALASKKSKRLRPKSMEMDESLPAPGMPPLDGQPSKTSDSAPGSSAASTKGLAAALKTSPPNLVLPSFRSTYRYKENPSILRQIAQFILPSQQVHAGSHLFLSKEPVRFKKAVAIGVHGLFPAAFLRPMIGQPTGTSLRFANHAAEAVRRWADQNGSADCEIEKIALEGEGKIGERVENLWKLLLNWVDHIRHADVVVLACHSQGVPVGFMLLAKLIELGIVTTARVGVCAMAGVSLGPFPEYKSGLGILMGSAGELWEFGNPESEVSKRYVHALKTALDYGVRVTYVGSIDDQVVPLESAFYSPVHHPYVYRAVFVDGRIHAPDFIAHLIGFACKLRNLGVSDHGLVRELSVPLAGSLYSGEGHSRLYDDPSVYDLALSHTLETADLDSSAKAATTCEIKKHEGLTSPNPYVLPWIMRGLLEEEFVRTELHAETAELVRQFDDWKPTTKALKDVKYRLEAVRSKL